MNLVLVTYHGIVTVPTRPTLSPVPAAGPSLGNLLENLMPVGSNPGRGRLGFESPQARWAGSGSPSQAPLQTGSE